MKSERFKIIAAQSNIGWVARKVTGSHNGTINIKEGALDLRDGRLVGGKFAVDATSIKILDITDPATNAQFAGHLASDDFFASEQYPDAQFVITSVEPVENNTYIINGDLTIKGITHPTIFTALLKSSDAALTATGKIILDRTKYDMKFRSGNFFQDLGDNLIYNNFKLVVNIIANAVNELASVKNLKLCHT
jgi:polyisoprenoid-binding protein YceI